MSTMGRYVGRRADDRGARVLFDDGSFASVLNKRLDLRNHSPDGFNWGYGGSGPAQLALAILAHQMGDEFALEHYQDYKREVIAMIDTEQFEIKAADVKLWAAGKGTKQ